MANIISEMTPNEQKVQSRIDRFFGQINLSKMFKITSAYYTNDTWIHLNSLWSHSQPPL
jgi:sulfur relay (sulfurtransferase) DsrF/TusC family protein